MKSTRRRARAHQRGFSLLEALIAAALLGVGLLGLSSLHVSALRGTVSAEDVTRGAQVAREIAEFYSTQDFQAISNLPAACGPLNQPPLWATTPLDGQGCKAAGAVTDMNFTAVVPGCTAFITNEAWVADPMTSTVLEAQGWDYRVDIRVSAHPDPVAYPPAPDPNGSAVAVLWVWVCWRDQLNAVHEVSSMRVIPENM